MLRKHKPHIPPGRIRAIRRALLKGDGIRKIVDQYHCGISTVRRIRDEMTEAGAWK